MVQTETRGSYQSSRHKSPGHVDRSESRELDSNFGDRRVRSRFRKDFQKVNVEETSIPFLAFVYAFICQSKYYRPPCR